MDPSVTKLVVLAVAGAVCIYYGILCTKGDTVLKNGTGTPQSLDNSKGYDTKKTGIAGGYALIFVGVLTVLLGVFVFFYPQYIMKAAAVYGGCVAVAILVLIVLVKTMFTRKL